MDKQKALIGTAKGLIVYHFEAGKKPVLDSIHFQGFSVNMVFVDERNGQWWVGISHKGTSKNSFQQKMRYLLFY